MADAYLLETGTDHFLLEDSSGIELEESLGTANLSEDFSAAGSWPATFVNSSGAGPGTVSGGQAVGGSSTPWMTYRNSATDTDDQYSQVTLVAVSPTIGHGPAVAMTNYASLTTAANVPTFYAMKMASASSLQIVQKNSGLASFTVLASVSYTAVAGDVFRLEYVNHVLTGYVNGVSKLTFTPDLGNAITGQRYVGLHWASATVSAVAIWDNWSGGDRLLNRSPAILQPSETDTPQSVTRVHSRTLSQPSETDLSQTKAKVTKAKAIGQASETDLSQTDAKVTKAKAIGQASETDTPQVLVQRIKIGQASDVEDQPAISPTKKYPAGQPSETDLSQTKAKVTKAKAIGQATETDLSQAATRKHSRNIGQALSTSLAQPFTIRAHRTFDIGQIEEVDEAFPTDETTEDARPVHTVKTKAIGQASEADSASQVVKHGSASGTYNWTGTATGKRVPKSLGTGTYDLSGAGLGFFPWHDPFTRLASGSLGQPWVSQSSPLQDISNAVQTPSSVALTASYYDKSITGATQMSQATYKASAGTGVAVAMPTWTEGDVHNTTGTYYVFNRSTAGGSTVLVKKRASSDIYDALVGGGPDVSANDVMRLEYDGTKLTAKINGSVVLTFSPITPITGQTRTGIVYRGTQINTTILDDWYGGVAGQGSASGTYDWAGTAVGKRVAKATGTTGTYDWTGTAVGKRIAKANRTGTYDWTGTVVGKRTPKAASTTGTYDWSKIAATGKRVAKSSPTGTYDWTGSSTGFSPSIGPHIGTSTGTYNWSGSVISRAPMRGSGSGTYAFDGTAAGKRVQKASGSGTYTYAGTTTGYRIPKSPASGTYTWAGTSVGKKTPKSIALGGLYDFSGTTTGKRLPKAPGSGTYTWAGSSIGVTGAGIGHGLGAADWSGTATARRSSLASSAGTYDWTGTVVGKRVPKTLLTGTYAFDGLATGRRTPKAAVAHAYDFSGTASGTNFIAFLHGSALGSYAYAASASGHKTILGTVEVVYRKNKPEVVRTE